MTWMSLFSLCFQTAGAYVATITAAIMVEIPRSLLFTCGWVGALGYLIYLLVMPGHGPAVATLVAGIGIAILSQLFARSFRAPVTMFYIPGFFPLVPGIGVYRTAFYYINDNPAQASYYMVQSALIAGAIALSIFLVDSCLEIYHHLRNQAKAKRKEQSHG